MRQFYINRPLLRRRHHRIAASPIILEFRTFIARLSSVLTALLLCLHLSVFRVITLQCRFVHSLDVFVVCSFEILCGRCCLRFISVDCARLVFAVITVEYICVRRNVLVNSVNVFKCNSIRSVLCSVKFHNFIALILRLFREREFYCVRRQTRLYCFFRVFFELISTRLRGGPRVVSIISRDQCVPRIRLTPKNPRAQRFLFFPFNIISDSTFDSHFFVPKQYAPEAKFN